MFKYAPGMESGLGAALNMIRKHAEPDGDEGTTVTNIFNMEDKKSGMNDIAGPMALMQRDSEIARLTRENEALKNKAIADSTAASVVQSLQGFAISHYKPTQTATAPTA